MENDNTGIKQPKGSKFKLPATKRLEKKVAEKILLVFICVTAGFVGGSLANRNNLSPATSTEAKQQIIASESQLINQIAKDVGPSVVSVNVTGTATTNSFFGQSQIEQESAGTGIILNTDGVIITNRHVVPSNTNSVSVTLSDGTTLDDVAVIGRTNDSDSLDVAFLKVSDKKGKTLTPAKLADSSNVQVGDKVVAIGNALGRFQNTVTSGIISGYGRDLTAGDETGSSSETLQNLFQTDTAINKGNSGGPLVNTSSEVIGINTAVGADAENLGFAIPINDVKGLIASVLKNGKLERPYLGVRYISLTDDYAYQYNLSVKRGAYLSPGQQNGSAVLSGSPADKAGLKEKDIITKINDTPVDEKNSLTSILGKFGVNEKVNLTIIRDGKEQKLTATLEAAPQNN